MKTRNAGLFVSVPVCVVTGLLCTNKCRKTCVGTCFVTVTRIVASYLSTSQLAIVLLDLMEKITSTLACTASHAVLASCVKHCKAAGVASKQQQA